MVLLRMLAFRPEVPASGKQAQHTAPPGALAVATAERVVEQAPPSSAGRDPDLANWHDTVERLGLGGMALQLGRNCVVESWDGRLLKLTLDPSHGHLLGSRAEDRLKDAICRLAGRPVAMSIAAAPVAAETPARRAERADSERREAALAAMRSDEVVQALAEHLDARLLEDSVVPLDGRPAGPAGRD